MRVLFLLTQDLESPSGLGRYLPLARELSKLGHEVKIAALHANYDSLEGKNLNVDGVEVSYVAPMHVMKSGDEKRYYSPSALAGVVMRATLALSQFAWRTPADIIHIGKPHPMNSVAGLLAGRPRGRTVLLDCDDYEAGSGYFKGGWQRRGVAFFERNVPRGVRGVTTNTDFMREKLHSWGVPEARIFYLPNGVDPHRFASPNAERVAALRNELDLQGKKVIAFIGTMSLVSHPVNLLIEAFAEIVRVCPNAVLLLVGGGEDVDRVKQQAARLGLGEFVRLAGRVPPTEVVNFYTLADVSADPVYEDDAARGRSPLKMFESWVCGVPFVTADVGDRQRWMGQPLAGVLAVPGNAQTLAEAICSVLADANEGKRLSQLGFARVKDFYWEKLAREVEGYYQHVLEGVS